MPENKRQHFVPRFYLEKFSFDGGARTNLIRIDELKTILNIGVADQCQEAYFYGKELSFEKALAAAEGEASRVIRDILSSGDIAPRGTRPDAFLKAYVCLQWTRTRAFSEGLDASFSKMVKAVAREDFFKAGFSEADLAKVEFGREEGPRDAVVQGVEFIPFFADLEPKLICANGLGEFITSDDPVVLLNPFYLGRFPGGISGPALEGTVILFPISPDYLVILYDRRCYRVGAPGKRVVPLGSITDLVALNNHQFLNADGNLYFRNSSLSAGHVAECWKVKNLRNGDRQQVREVPMAEKRTLLHSFTEPINYKPATSFMKVLKSRKGETGHAPQIPARDPALSAVFKAYTEAVQAGTVQRNFVGYLASIGNRVMTEEQKAAWSYPST